MLSRLCLLALLSASLLPAQSASVLVLRFHNDSPYPELNWIGESIAETLRQEFNQANQIVLEREVNEDGMKKLGLRQDAQFTRATIFELGQAVEADIVVYGSFQVKRPAAVTQLKDSEIEITARFIALRKGQSGPDLTESGKVADLAHSQEHLAWQALKYLNPGQTAPLEEFIKPQKLIRPDAEESYIHGILSADKDQQQKWLLQAANLDPNFVSPAFELGRLYLDRKDYRQSLKWLQRVPASDARFTSARFRMGLAAYGAGDFNAAVAYFKEVAGLMPLNEVYNNLAAAEDQLNLPSAIDDFRRALDGDPADAAYLFNLGSALLRRNLFEEAERRLQAAVNRAPDDTEADELLARSKDRDSSPPSAKPLAAARLKTNMDSTAFRQLKAMLQPKAKP